MVVDCDRRREGVGRWYERSGRGVEKREVLVRGHDGGSNYSVGCLFSECFVVSESTLAFGRSQRNAMKLVNYSSIGSAYTLSRMHSLLKF